MALGDRQHVEAVAIMKRMVEMQEEYGTIPDSLCDGAKQWLKENRPAPEVYLNSLSEAAAEDGT